MEVSESIRKEHWNKWYELFKCCNGRFISNPFECFGVMMVRYTFDNCDDYSRFCQEWIRITTPITESRRTWWRSIVVRLGLYYFYTPKMVHKNLDS